MQSVFTMVERWRVEGLQLYAPEAELAVRETFAKIGTIATADVISLYSALGGMEEMDREYWRLWPLSEVMMENAEGTEHGALFSDYLINCWSYRIIPNNNDTSSVFVDYFDRPLIKVAGSIDEFFRLYAVDPFQLLEGPYSSSPTNGDA